MRKYIYKISALLSLSALLCTGGCTDSFNDVNTDPDRTQDAPVTNVLAYVLQYSSMKLFDTWCDMNEPSTYGGQLAKIQYIDECRYEFRATVVESKWYYCNMLLNNIRTIQQNAAKDEAQNMVNVGKVLEVMIMQIATDTWRDLPYTEFGKMEEGILLPKYDRQEDIYPAMLALLKEAADSFAVGADDKLGEGDLLFAGNITKWQQYCNSLRLRLAMRIAKVAPELAKTTVLEITGDPGKYPIIKTNEDNAFFKWPGSSPYIEPWAKDFQGTRDDYGVSDVMINRLVSTNDPRLSVYAHVSTSKKEYKGYIIGAKGNATVEDISHIGTRFREEGDGFTPYFRAAETYFHLAEAALLGWDVKMTAETAYNTAVTLSVMESDGYYMKTVKGEDGKDKIEKRGTSEVEALASEFLEGSAKFNGTLEQLYWQEWVAVFKQGMEAWSLYRRTGIPSTHYVAPGMKYTGHNVSPFRYPYPNNEASLNTVNNKPFLDEVVDDFWGKQMWWDTRTNVQ